jgi:glycosyltransferase involved in cell wall biosynthesis
MFKKDNNEIFELLNIMNINSECVVINQCDKNSVEYLKYKKYTVTVVYSTERGLSRSRNLALRYAKADIVIIADDDIRYVDDYSEILLKAYELHKNTDIITFKVHEDKKYFPNEKRLNKFLVHKVISHEISMKLELVKNLTFNVMFGTGSPYYQHGEENIFLTECIKKHGDICYIPLKLASLIENSRPSTWFNGFDKKYFIDQGALYYELSHFLAIPYILQFAMRKHTLYKATTGFLQAVYFMLYGMRQYKALLMHQVINK